MQVVWEHFERRSERVANSKPKILTPEQAKIFRGCKLAIPVTRDGDAIVQSESSKLRVDSLSEFQYACQPTYHACIN